VVLPSPLVMLSVIAVAMAAIAFVAMFARWVYDRRRGINPLAQELEVLQKLRAQNQ
jgi:anti-sigma-K factor RskA